MAKLRSLFSFFLPVVNSAYPDAASLFQGLEAEESAAIGFLYTKIAPAVSQLGLQYNLSEEDIEELAGDCIALLIQKIRNKEYVFQGYSPVTYTVEIAKNKAKTFHKKKQRFHFLPLEAIPDQPEETPDDPTDWQQTRTMENLLARLSENCRQLIRLKYLDEWPDKTVIEQKMTQYTTVDALKNKRAQCMKKLTEMLHK
jgi:RNA polymerase sigma factor (sigma-70 family)